MKVSSKRLIRVTQDIYRFENGYGALVVRHEDNYGGKEGLFELAVIKWTEDMWHFKTSDILGYLTVDEVASTLKEIERL